jgi:hypothetical protein
MVALATSFLTDPWTPAEIADLDREIAQLRNDVSHLRGVLKRPDVTGTYAQKIGWQLEAAERGLARYLRIREGI